MWWHALRLRGFLWRGCQPRTALSRASCHDAAEEVAWSVANLGRLWLGVVLRALGGTAAGFNFALEL